MFNKKTSYEVNVQGITFWRKKINVDNTEVFVRECLNDPFMLYLDKVKGDNYLDWVTGRPFIMEDFGKDFLLSLSNIKISKENVKNSEVLDLYEVKVDNVCKAVVNKLVEVSADLTYTDSTGAIVNASDIKNNTSKYTEIIKNNIENLVIYSRKDKVYVDVNPISLLKILGLNTSNSSKIVDVTSVAIN